MRNISNAVSDFSKNCKCSFPHLKENFGKFSSLQKLIATSAAYYSIPREATPGTTNDKANDRSKSAGNTPGRQRDGRKPAADQRDGRKTAAGQRRYSR